MLPKKFALISKKQKQKIKGKPKCTICLTERTFIDKIEDKYDLERELEILSSSFLLTNVIKEHEYKLRKM